MTGDTSDVIGMELDSISLSEVIGGPRDGKTGLNLKFKGGTVGILLEVSDAILLRDALNQLDLEQLVDG